MDQLIEFGNNHFLLLGTFVALSAMLVWNVFFDPIAKAAVGPVEGTAMINHEEALVLDVRSMAEFKQGHIVNAINIPLNSLSNQIKTIEKHKGKPIIVACRSGSRSATACRALVKAGFQNVHNLRGGMMAWESASLPVNRKS